MRFEPDLTHEPGRLPPSEEKWAEKEEERRHLGYFLDAREHVTGETLEVRGSGESPDFVVRRQIGNYAGVELTRVYYNDPGPRWDLPFRWHSAWDVVDEIFRLIGQKEKKRSSPESGWSYRKQTILVLTLMDVPLDEVAAILEEVPPADYECTGFPEIWVADLNPRDLDAYSGDIRLFGMRPKKWRGFHERVWPHRKPWG